MGEIEPALAGHQEFPGQCRVLFKNLYVELPVIEFTGQYQRASATPDYCNPFIQLMPV